MPKRLEIYTSDEKIRNLSIRKEEINNQLLTVLKETAVDCKANQPDNEPLDCFTVAVAGTPYMFDPDLERDKSSTQIVGGPKKKVEEAATVKATTTAVKISLEVNDTVGEFLLGDRDPAKDFVEIYEANDTARTRPLGKLTIDPSNPEDYGDVEFY